MRRGSDEGDPTRGTGLRELGVLREEAVARVDGIGARDLCRRDEARDAQIGLPRGGRPDTDIVIGEADMERFPVGLGVHGDGLHSEFAAGAHDAQRDLPTVGDQDLTKHQRTS